MGLSMSASAIMHESGFSGVTHKADFKVASLAGTERKLIRVPNGFL